MRFSKTWLLSTLALLACDEASIGRDVCVGKETRCSALDDIRDPSPAFLPEIEKVGTAELQILEPIWERPVSEGPAYVSNGEPFGGVLTGSGQAGLWYLNNNSELTAIEARQLDGEGKVLSERLITQTFVGALSPSTHAVATSKSNGFSPHAAGAAVVLDASWRTPCAASGGCTEHELIVLDADAAKAPFRLSSNDFAVSYAAPSRDGGAWVYGATPLISALRKYDARGKVSIRQTLIEDTAAFSQSSSSGARDGELLALAADQTLYVYGYAHNDSDKTEIWSFDANGNARFRRTLSKHSGANLVADMESRAVLFSVTPAGDLLVERFGEDGDVSEAFSALRDSFSDLAVQKVTEDAGGNLYVSLYAGTRSERTPVVCKLPLTGLLSCYAVPAMETSTIVGGEENVFYGLVGVDRHTRVNVDSLQRFELQ